MDKTKIEPKEQEEVLDLIKTYRFYNDKIAECMVEIKNLETKKNELIKSIEETREREMKWVGGMIDKYGAGRLNLESMEWHPDPVAPPTVPEDDVEEKSE